MGIRVVSLFGKDFSPEFGNLFLSETKNSTTCEFEERAEEAVLIGGGDRGSRSRFHLDGIDIEKPCADGWGHET